MKKRKLQGTTETAPGGSVQRSVRRFFPLGEVLSVTTGRCCCEMSGIYEILNHVTGDNLFTHSIPRAIIFAAPLILKQYPELATAGTEAEMQRLSDEVKLAKQPMAGVRKWLSGLKLRTEYEMASHADVWLSIDPLAELEGMVGKEKIVVVRA
jgi:hypothetical protein